jgi:DNA repair exonuclease SbcCD nuclease subunit
MKFIHTADWQIGMKAAHVGAVGARVREARLEAARKVIETAQAHSAEFILLAGDTFEDNGVDRVLVQKTADILAKSSVPVYIIPGNHDPLVPGSVWDHPAWVEHDNLRILKFPEPLAIPGGTLYPCPIVEKHSRKDPTAWIDATRSQGPRIGLAHGTVEGMPQLAPDHPVPRNAAQRTGLGYLALGHWHSTATYEDPAGTAHMAYSGTHETTRFGERDSGNILVVEIPSAGAPPTITPIRTGTLTWLTLDEEIGEEGDLGRARALVEQAQDPEKTLIEVRLSGLLPGSVGPELARLQEVLESRFLYHRLDTDGLRPAPEDDTWLQGLPQGVLREAALQLRDLAASDQTTDPETSPRVAAQALMELYALVQGAES